MTTTKRTHDAAVRSAAILAVHVLLGWSMRESRAAYATPAGLRAAKRWFYQGNDTDAANRVCTQNPDGTWTATFYTHRS